LTWTAICRPMQRTSMRSGRLAAVEFGISRHTLIFSRPFRPRPRPCWSAGKARPAPGSSNCRVLNRMCSGDMPPACSNLYSTEFRTPEMAGCDAPVWSRFGNSGHDQLNLMKLTFRGKLSPRGFSVGKLRGFEGPAGGISERDPAHIPQCGAESGKKTAPPPPRIP
jgi:hypothetical protein